MKLKSLIIGGDGMIGNHLRRYLEAKKEEVFTTSRRKNSNDIYFDLSTSNLRNMIFPKVDTVYICAGMTGFKDCEENIELARKINIDAPTEIAKVLSQTGAHVIYLSTSAVFDGKTPKYKNNFNKSPKSIYGKTKSEGEDSILRVGNKISILRLTKVIHENLPIFKKWSDLLKDNKKIHAFTDLYFCPILIDDVINVLSGIAKKNEGGIYQVSGESDINYYDAAIFLAKILKADPALVCPSKSSDNNFLAENILRHTSLDTSSLPKELNFITPKPLDVLKKVFEKYI